MNRKYNYFLFVAALVASTMLVSCVKSIPERQTVQLADIYQDAENSKPWFKIADGDYTLLANTKDNSAAITVRFEITGDTKAKSVQAVEADVRKTASLSADADLSKDFSNKNYYLVPLDEYGNVITITGAEGTAGYLKGVSEEIYNFVSYADVGTVRPFGFKIAVQDKKSLAAVMGAAGFRIVDEGSVSYPVAGGGGGTQSKVYKVGVDLAAGEYFLETTGNDLTYRIDGDAAFEETMRNNTFLILKKGETLTLTGGGKITPAAEVSRKPKSLDSIPPGYYRVGKDIPAGKYTVTGNTGYLFVAASPLDRDAVETYEKGSIFGETRWQNGQSINYEESYESVYADWATAYEENRQDFKKKFERDMASRKNPAARYLEAKNGQYLLVSRDSSPAKLVK